jgi:hypothetical protein
MEITVASTGLFMLSEEMFIALGLANYLLAAMRGLTLICSLICRRPVKITVSIGFIPFTICTSVSVRIPVVTYAVVAFPFLQTITFSPLISGMKASEGSVSAFGILSRMILTFVNAPGVSMPPWLWHLARTVKALVEGSILGSMA